MGCFTISVTEEETEAQKVNVLPVCQDPDPGPPTPAPSPLVLAPFFRVAKPAFGGLREEEEAVTFIEIAPNSSVLVTSLQKW